MTQNYFRPTHNVNMSELSELLASKTEYGEFYLGTVSYKGYTGEIFLSKWENAPRSFSLESDVEFLKSVHAYSFASLMTFVASRVESRLDNMSRWNDNAYRGVRQRCDDLGRLCDEYGVPYELGPYAHAI